ncbi:sodium- and chloride-dependent GABA transporter 1-like [Pocillopora verrucosa]|uniref:sodium- and chloride-dependent GABA transporter 1-like n=1 Tax=Pocillopora verrucosa TaxID=203993 RepID=UPI00333EAA4F
MNMDKSKSSDMESSEKKLIEKGKEANGEQASDASGSSSAVDERDVQVVEIEDEREQWGKKADFLLSCIGFAVGLGNVWRFPYLCYDNGGGAFLIPYLIMLVLCGMPMFYMELAVGQYFSLGPIGTWGAICPLFQGVGFASMMVSFLVCVYYNIIIAWCLYFLFLSFRKDVPWKSCGNWWNSEKCYAGRIPECSSGLSNGTVVLANSTAALANSTLKNCTKAAVDDFSSPALEYWQNYVLRLTDSIGDAGVFRWEILLCLLAAWIGVYFCMWKGVKSSGKVVYFTATFPYVVLFILFIRGVTLPNAKEGIIYYLKPQWYRLKDPKVWVAAATQIFYSLGIGFGSLVAMGSYNKFHNNVFKDAMMISLINCATSVFAGFVIFSTLGFMAHSLNKKIEDVASSGPGLAFVVYPEAIAQMPVSPLWAILFFFMLLTLGLDSQFGMMEAVITGVVDEYRIFRRHKELFILVACILCFLLGLPCVTQGGAYVLNLFDYQSGGVSLLFLAFFETVTLAWIYGTDRFSLDIEKMIGRRPGAWWWFCWRFCAPLIMAGIFLFSVSQWGGISYGDYKYPPWAEFIGWLIALSSMLFIPGVAIYNLYMTPGTFMERLYICLKPDPVVQKEIEERQGLEHQVELIKV